MKKIALAAFSATALLALSACGDAADEAAVEETTEVETAPVEPVVEDTTVVEGEDTMAEEGDTMAEETPAAEETPVE